MSEWELFDVRCKCGDTYQVVNSGLHPMTSANVSDWIAKWVREHRCAP